MRGGRGKLETGGVIDMSSGSSVGDLSGEIIISSGFGTLAGSGTVSVSTGNAETDVSGSLRLSTGSALESHAGMYLLHLAKGWAPRPPQLLVAQIHSSMLAVQSNFMEVMGRLRGAIRVTSGSGAHPMAI